MKQKKLTKQELLQQQQQLLEEQRALALYKQQEYFQSIIQSSSIVFQSSKQIFEIIWQRFERSVYLNEIDAKRNDYCTELALLEGAKTCKMIYNLNHDKGEKQETFQLMEDLSNDEPVQPGKDTTTSQSIKREIGKQIENKDTKTMSNPSYGSNKNLKQMLQEYSSQRKKHLNIKSVEKEGIPVKDPRAIEDDDDLAMRVRQQKDQAKQKIIQQEKEKKEKAYRERQQIIEMDMINKELEGAKFTYDYKGNILFQSELPGDYLPSDVKFKYKMKKAQSNDNNEENEKTKYKNKEKNQNKVNYNNLAKLSDQENITKEKQTGGNMFDYFNPSETGVKIQQDKRVKVSKKDFYEKFGKMSIEVYKKKQEENQTINAKKDKDKLEETNEEQSKFNSQCDDQLAKDQYINQLRQSTQLKKQSMFDEYNDHHNVLIQQPQVLHELIVFPEEQKFQKENTFRSQQSELEKTETDPKYQTQNNFMASSLKNMTLESPQLHQKTSIQRYNQTANLQQRKQLQDKNAEILETSNWGYNSLPKIDRNLAVQSQQAQKRNLQSRQGAGQTKSSWANRPFSRATMISNSQGGSMRQMTTATSQRTTRRNVQNSTIKNKNNNIFRLAPPPLGKTMGHGLLRQKFGMTTQSQQSLHKQKQNPLNMLGQSSVDL